MNYDGQFDDADDDEDELVPVINQLRAESKSDADTNAATSRSHHQNAGTFHRVDADRNPIRTRPASNDSSPSNSHRQHVTNYHRVERERSRVAHDSLPSRSNQQQPPETYHQVQSDRARPHPTRNDYYIPGAYHHPHSMEMHQLPAGSPVAHDSLPNHSYYQHEGDYNNRLPNRSPVAIEAAPSRSHRHPAMEHRRSESDRNISRTSAPTRSHQQPTTVDHCRSESDRHISRTSAPTRSHQQSTTVDHRRSQSDRNLAMTSLTNDSAQSRSHHEHAVEHRRLQSDRNSTRTSLANNSAQSRPHKVAEVERRRAQSVRRTAASTEQSAPSLSHQQYAVEHRRTQSDRIVTKTSDSAQISTHRQPSVDHRRLQSDRIPARTSVASDFDPRRPRHQETVNRQVQSDQIGPSASFPRDSVPGRSRIEHAAIRRVQSEQPPPNTSRQADNVQVRSHQQPTFIVRVHDDRIPTNASYGTMPFYILPKTQPPAATPPAVARTPPAAAPTIYTRKRHAPAEPVQAQKRPLTTFDHQKKPQVEVPSGARKPAKPTSSNTANDHKKRVEESSPKPRRNEEFPSPREVMKKSPIIAAARAIGLELVEGIWPSPYSNEQESTEGRAHRHHMHIVASSLEDFAKKIIGPSLLKAPIRNKDAVASGNKSSNELELPRSFFGTLILLRELLTQNGPRIFGDISLDNIDTESSGEQSQQQKQSSYISKEESLYGTRTLATGVTVAAIQRCCSEELEEAATNTFLNLIRSYDEGDEEFASCIPRPEPQKSRYVPTRQSNSHEEVACGVSIHRAYERHPLVQRQLRAKTVKPLKSFIQVPVATACHIAVVGKIKRK